MADRRRPRKGDNFIVQGGILAIAGIVTRIIGLFYRVPVTNIIGDEGNGYYAVAYQIYNIMLLITSYSLPLAISKVVSARYSGGEYRNSFKALKGGLIFAGVSGGTACLLVFFGARFFAGTLMSEPMSAIALRIFAPTLLVVAVMGVVRGFFQGMGTMVPTAISQIIEQVVNAVVSIIAAKQLFGYGQKVSALLKNPHFAPAYGAAGSTLGTSMGALSGLLFLIFILVVVVVSMRRDQLKEDRNADEELVSIIKIIFLTAVPVILSTAIYNVSDILENGIFNRIMSIKGRDLEKTAIWGIYSGKYRLMINVPIALANAMCASTVPVLTACIRDRNIRMAKRKIATAMRFTMLIAFPCFIGMSVLSEPILSMLFKGDLSLASNLLRAGSISIVFYSIATLTNGVLQGINHMRTPVIHASIALVLHLAMLFVGLGRFNMGIYGVVCANILFSLSMCIMNFISIYRYINYRQEWFRTFIVPGVSSLIMGVVVFALYHLYSQVLGNTISTLLSIILGAVIYFVIILRLKGVRENELKGMPFGGIVAAMARKLHLL